MEEVEFEMAEFGDAGLEVDGDFLGLREEMTFTSVPDAVSVVAPPPEAS